jgi:chemotaxis protein histidine kinase CheA
MVENKQRIKKKLYLLTLKYREKLPRRLQELGKFMKLLLSKKWDKKIALKIESELHKLTGTGKSFGFTTLSAKAHRMKLLLSDFIKKDRELKEDQKQQLVSLFSELQESLDDFGEGAI